MSKRAIEDKILKEQIHKSWNESGKVYGYRKVHQDMLDEGVRCSKHRVYRLMKSDRIRAMVGYKRRIYKYGKPSIVAENHLKQEFHVDEPNKIWVTDITYIRTMEGWLYLCVVVDLFSRQVVG